MHVVPIKALPASGSIQMPLDAWEPCCMHIDLQYSCCTNSAVVLGHRQPCAWHSPLPCCSLRQAVQRFVVADLSNWYLDVIKDRLYVSAPGSFDRRASQTVLAALLQVWGPVWQHVTATGLSVRRCFWWPCWVPAPHQEMVRRRGAGVPGESQHAEFLPGEG